MKKIYRQIIIAFILSSVIALVQFSLISSWPPVFNKINLSLISLIFILFFFGRRSALVMALFLGFWLDFLSFNFFGLYLVTFFLALLATDWILTNRLTNRSLYSFLALTTIINIFYNLCFYLFLYLSQADGRTFFIIKKNFWLAFSWELIWSLVAAMLLFSLAASLTKKLQPFFLEKK